MTQFDELELRINQVVEEVLGIQVDNIHTNFSDMDIDSLDAVELIMAWEDKFGIEITDDEAENIRNMETAYKILKTKIQN
jgi:acyl carrier protein